MPITKQAGATWDALLADYLARVGSAAHRASRVRAAARAERAVDIVIDFCRTTGLAPSEVTFDDVDAWLRRSGPRTRTQKAERTALVTVLDHAVLLGAIPMHPLRASAAWIGLIDDYVAASTDRLTPRALESIRSRVLRFGAWAAVPPAAIDEPMICRYLVRPGFAEATVKAARRSINLVLRFGVGVGEVERNAARVLPDLHAPIGVGRSWEVIATGDVSERDAADGLPYVETRVFTVHPVLRWAEATGRVVERAGNGGRVSPSLLEAWRRNGSPVVVIADEPVVASWDRLFVSYAIRATAAGRTWSTLKQRHSSVTRFARWSKVRPEDVSEGLLVRYLSDPTMSAEYRRATRTALRMVFHHAHRSGLVSANPAVDLDPVRVPVGPARPAPEDVIGTALNGLAARERLMILLGGLAGCRRAEIAALRCDDITPDGLRIVGKGGRARLVPIHPALAPELAKWQRVSPERSEWLFPGGTDGHLSPGYVGHLISRALPGSWSAHSLRHRFGTRAYAGGFDILAVQELLGHASPATTARYIAVPKVALVRAVDAVPPIPGMDAARTRDAVLPG